MTGELASPDVGRIDSLLGEVLDFSPLPGVPIV